MIFLLLTVFIAIICTSVGLPTPENSLEVPPTPRFRGNFDEQFDHEKIADDVKSWKTDDPDNVWEKSGLFEGDIMIHPEIEITKNGVLDTKTRWAGGVVPYYIQKKDFDEEDIAVIKKAMEEYHEKTCLRFRPYKPSDEDYIMFEGKRSGCWSLVGRHGRGQTINLQNPGCVHHGVVIHEIMHAVGFFHQQSQPDRDQWIQIHWENIQPGREHNFNKYTNKTVTDYGVGYDYSSVMHYSSHAFSKNGEPTIEPKKMKIKLGQRKGLSEKDIKKLEFMYKDECSNKTPDKNKSKEDTFGWLFG